MEIKQSEYYAIILGALLHDIGKFVQRAQTNPMSQDHSRWGEEWFQNHLSEKLSKVFNEREKQFIRSAIGNHHEHEKFISLADAISAGMDRIAIKMDEEEKGDPFSDRLISIFSKVSISNEPKPERYYKFASLGKGRFQEIFPVDQKKCSSKEYAQLLAGFEKEIASENFDNLSPQQLVDYFYFLLWKYCWCIPSATYKIEPDVPLFDHLKTTAAIAGCFYAYQYERPAGTINIDSKGILLIGGDLSGIQTYIFDVLTQQGKVAKRLRARSLFVQLISEVSSHKILQAFQLPLCNQILSAGGNFYILAPNLKDAPKTIEALQKEFDSWTMKRLNAELSISLATEELSGRDLVDFSGALDRLKGNLSRKKYQPHKTVLSNNGKWAVREFIRPEVVEGDEKACQGCQKFPIKETTLTDDLYCERCSNDTRIGQLLPKTRYIAFFNDDLHEFELLNHSFELWPEIITQKTKEKPYLILALNNPDIKLPVLGFKYLANYIPVSPDVASSEVGNGQPVTFNDIANASDGDKLIGYVKADVDNMGLILREGFKDTRLSISRFATFSRLLETFFSGYLQARMEETFKELYTIFSGGDDLFVLGPWNKSIDFANTIRKEFSWFCASNPDLTFSAGIFITKPYNPISHCAEIVEEKLKNSKGKEGKDRITLFNQTVRWKDLEEKILKEANQIIEWLEREPPVVSRGFINNLREYGEMAQSSNIFEPSLGVNTEFLRFVPLLVYDIKRNLTKGGQKVALVWAEDLIPTVDKPQGGENLEFLKTIMDYVLTYTRS